MIPSWRDVSVQLKVWRSGAGMTVDGAAARIGVNVRMYRAWEAGVPCPYPHMIDTVTRVPVRRIRQQQMQG